MLRFRSLARLPPGLLAVLALAACSGSATPALIGSYPKSLVTVVAPAGLVVYASDLDLQVNSVDATTRRAAEIAGSYGGYLTEAALWYASGRPQATVTLAIPVGYYADARQAMLALGSPTGERLTGDLTVLNHADRWATYTRLTLHLTETPPPLPRLSWPAFGWSPAQTLAQALGVAAALFTILLDVVIWVVVVVGPFVVLGLGIRWVVRQVKK